jgi:hypothetical protein
MSGQQRPKRAPPLPPGEGIARVHRAAEGLATERRDDLNAAVDRINKGLERFADLGLERILAGRQGPGIMLDDLRLVLASVQVPCVGAGELREAIKDALWPVLESYQIGPAVAALLPLISVQPVLDGEWVLVPKEPTRAMLEAGVDQTVQQYEDNANWDDAKDVIEKLDQAALYRAMLSAAPSLPDSQTSGGGKDIEATARAEYLRFSESVRHATDREMNDPKAPS